MPGQYQHSSGDWLATFDLYTMIIEEFLQTMVALFQLPYVQKIMFLIFCMAKPPYESMELVYSDFGNQL